MSPIRLGPIRGCYDGLVVVTTLTRASVPRPLLTRLPPPELASDLVTSLTALFMQEDSALGQVRPGQHYPSYYVHGCQNIKVVVHGDAGPLATNGYSSKSGGFCIYVGYRCRQ